MIRFAFCFFALFLSGCGGLHAEYVAADRATFEYAQPKLEEWAEEKDDEWKAVVKAKGLAWEARIKRAEEALMEDE